jgi:hypothetical protein
MTTTTAWDPASSIPDNIGDMSELEKQIYFACRNGRTVQSVTEEEDKQKLAVFMQWYDSRITAKKARDQLFPWMGWQYSRSFDVLFKENSTLKIVLKYWSEWKKAYRDFIGTKTTSTSTSFSTYTSISTPTSTPTSEPSQQLQEFRSISYLMNAV